jgi:hypothetical protein
VQVAVVLRADRDHSREDPEDVVLERQSRQDSRCYRARV